MSGIGPPIRVTVTFEDGTVTLLPRRAPVGNSGPIRGETLAALPLIGSQLSEMADRLTVFLGRPVVHAPATLSIGAGDGQPGIAVLGLTEAEAERIGATIGLEFVFFWDGRRASVLACAPDS